MSVFLLAVGLIITLRFDFGTVTPPKPIKVYDGGSDTNPLALTRTDIIPTEIGTVVELAFAYNDGSETTPGIPRMIVQQITDPYRIIVRVPSLAAYPWRNAFTDTIINQEQSGGIVSGIFAINDTIYVQLNTPATVSAQVSQGLLRLSFEKREEPAKNGYIAIIDSITDYAASESIGEMIDMGVYPALADDGVTILAQSYVMPNGKQAETVALTLSKVAQKHGIFAAANTQKYTGNAVSPTRESFMFGRLGAMLVADDAVPLAAAPPYYLVARSNGSIMLAREDAARVPLPVRLDDRNKAALSGGASFAVLRGSRGGYTLLNMLTGKHIDLGIFTGENDPFTFSGDTLLTMTGEPKAYYKLDVSEVLFNDEYDANEALTLADSFAGEDGELYAGDRFQYLLTRNDKVYRLDNANDTRTLLGEANRIAISQSGETAMLSSGDNMASLLVWVDSDDNARTIVGAGLRLVDFCVDTGGEAGYMLLESGGSYELHRYDAATHEVSRLEKFPLCDIMAASDSGSIIAIVIEGGVTNMYKVGIR